MALLRRVRQGEPFVPSATAHSALVDDHEYVEQLKRSAGGGALRDIWVPNTVLVRNDSGVDRERFDVLGISGPSFSPAVKPKSFKKHILFVGVKPDLTEHVGRWVILLKPARKGKIVKACCTGVCPARINVVYEEHDRAELKHQDAGALQSGHAGTVKILCKEPGTGVRLAYVRFEPLWPTQGLQLAENHKGREEEIKVWISRKWDPDVDEWEPYDKSKTYIAKDFRYGMPQPNKCATGLGQWKPSVEHGQSLEIIDLDCKTPGCAGSS